jgi:hypothetical protein
MNTAKLLLKWLMRAAVIPAIAGVGHTMELVTFFGVPMANQAWQVSMMTEMEQLMTGLRSFGREVMIFILLAPMANQAWQVSMTTEMEPRMISGSCVGREVMTLVLVGHCTTGLGNTRSRLTRSFTRQTARHLSPEKKTGVLPVTMTAAP